MHIQKLVGKFFFTLSGAISAFFAISADQLNYSAQAITIRDDRYFTQYMDLAKNYPSVGKLDVFSPSSSQGSVCSGTLIRSTWVLTAAHCLEKEVGEKVFEQANSGIFTIGGSKYNVVGGVMKSEWLTKNRNLHAGFDIGLFKLDESKPVMGVNPAPLYTGRQENLRVGTYVGFGMTGTGSTGAILDTQGDEKLAAQNLIELVKFKGTGTTGMITSDFDNPAVAYNQFNYDENNFPTNLEGNITKGDSGGGVFVNTKSGVPVLVGVNSFTNSPTKSGEGAGKYNKLLAFGVPEQRATMGAIRVRSFVGWIDQVIENFELSGPLKKLPSGKTFFPGVEAALAEGTTIQSGDLYEFVLTEDIFANPLVEGADDSFVFAGNSGNPTPVPTPALLPGLIGLGLGVWRKRKTEAES
jgi:hypothetical protein